MNKVFSTAILIASVALFSSCNEKASLAKSINGAWSGQAERVDVPDSKTTTTVTRMMTFNTDAGSSTGGTIDATAMFSLESGTQLLPAGTQPIAVTVNGTATISGHWEATDDDEIIVSFDSKTLKVEIDPDEIVLEYDIATQESYSVSDSIQAGVVASVSRSMATLLQHRVFNFNKIDDIKVKGSLMSCEIGKTDYTFHRDM